jgi:osmoprotectant transport system permease protein
MTPAMILLLCIAAPPEIKVGSKAFTESVILGEIATIVGEQTGANVQHVDQVGGTMLLWNALKKGDIDAYPDYTGTIIKEILKDDRLVDFEAMRKALASHDVLVTQSLGFSNPYQLGMPEAVAERLEIRKISDLKNHPQLKFAFSSEFMQRDDGWPSLKQRYRLPHGAKQVKGMEHALAYKAMGDDPAVDIVVTDTYATDPKIAQFGMRVLEDDLEHFPKYDTVFLYRQDLQQRAPKFVKALRDLEGRISNDEMFTLNCQVEIDGNKERQVAGDFLQLDVKVPGLGERLLRTTLEHLYLVIVSLVAAIFVAVPLGVVAAKKPGLGHAILTSAEIIQTIPGLALLVLLMPPLSSLGFSRIGAAPAIVALFLYSLLPIIRNTHTGLTSIPASMLEAAAAIGLSPWAQLWQVELPMASRMILAGIKTTAAINVGFATLGGLIGAGGYGGPIMEGLRLDNQQVMLEGAIPAALLALAVKGVFELIERALVPKGLRLEPIE